MHQPGAIGLLFGYARLAVVEQRQRSIDRLAHRALRAGIDLGARLPGGVNDGGESVGHGIPLLDVKRHGKAAARCQRNAVASFLTASR